MIDWYGFGTERIIVQFCFFIFDIISGWFTDSILISKKGYGCKWTWEIMIIEQEIISINRHYYTSCKFL